MKKDKVCVFIWDYVARPINKEEILTSYNDDTEYKFLRVSLLSKIERSYLPTKYKSEGWKVINKKILK